MDTYLAKAQADLDVLLQATVRRVAWALAGLDILAALAQLVGRSNHHLREMAPLAFLAGLAMVVLALWLRNPRPAPRIHAAAGLAALLAATTALVHLGLTRDARETTHLILIEVGAGFFLLSPLWFAFTTALLGGGWTLLCLTLPLNGDGLHFGVALGVSALLGLLVHQTRRKLIEEVLVLQALDHRREAEQARLVAQLQEALEGIKTLRGLIPMCAQCKKVRDDQGFWQQVEVYVHDHSEASFSHGLCPECLAAAKAEWKASQEDTWS